MERLCAAIAPGSSAVRVRRLRGGVDAATHAVDIQEPSGAHRRLVVRRYDERLLAEDTAPPAQIWQTLKALEQLGINAPRPVWLDDSGAVFDSPTLVTDWLSGRAVLSPGEPDKWIEQLATALATIHRASITNLDLSFLPGPGQSVQRTMEIAARSGVEQHPDGRAALAALQRWRPRLRRMTATLVHGDYWAGNTLWLRGRLHAVLDWDSAGIDYPGIDVGYCRMDLAMLMGGDAPDRFLSAYETAAGRHIPQLFFWDLLGALRALPDPAKWLPGYSDLGATQVTREMMRQRLHEFIAAALQQTG